jgi:hypothetical protein
MSRVSVFHTFFGLVFGWLLFHFLGPLGLHNGPKIHAKINPNSTPGALLRNTPPKYQVSSHLLLIFQNVDVPQTLLIMYPNDISPRSVQNQNMGKNDPQNHEKIVQKP